MEDRITHLLEKYDLLAFQEKFFLAGVRSLKDLAHIDKTSLRSYYLMLDADINNFEKLRSECIIACQSTTPPGSLPPSHPLSPSHSMSPSQVSGAMNLFSLPSLDCSVEYSMCSIQSDLFPIIVTESRSRVPVGEVCEENGAYLLTCFSPFEVRNRESKIPKYNLVSPEGYKGLGLICVIEKFVNGHKRLGAANDTARLEKLFNKMQLRIIVISNPTRAAFISEITKQIGMHLEFPSVLLAISSHGQAGNKVLFSDYKTATVAEILAHFKISELLGKPKVLLIEACRGAKHDTYIQTDVYSPETETHNTYPAATKESDILVAYSCVPGYVAYRDTSNGSWFVTALCEAFEELVGEGADFFSVLTYANQIMLRNHFEKEEQITKQSMHLESTLSKLLIF